MSIEEWREKLGQPPHPGYLEESERKRRVIERFHKALLESARKGKTGSSTLSRNPNCTNPSESLSVQSSET
jgi:hypothetical protein